MLTMVRDIEKFQEGFDSGFDSGYDKRGKEEYRKLIESVINMLNDHMPAETISKYLRLSLQEIEEIRETYSNTSI